MAQIFTNRLVDFYLQNTNLAQVEENGELQLEGAVTGYRLAPVAPTAAQNNDLIDAAALTRLTITVSVSYINTTDETFDFENKTFSFFEDFDSNQNLATIEAELINTIFDQVVLDIFNATVANR